MLDDESEELAWLEAQVNRVFEESASRRLPPSGRQDMTLVVGIITGIAVIGLIAVALTLMIAL